MVSGGRILCLAIVFGLVAFACKTYHDDAPGSVADAGVGPEGGGTSGALGDSGTSGDAGGTSSSSSGEVGPQLDGTLLRDDLPGTFGETTVDATYFYYGASRTNALGQTVSGLARVRLDSTGAEEFTPGPTLDRWLFSAGGNVYFGLARVDRISVDAFTSRDGGPTLTTVLSETWRDAPTPAGDFFYILSRERNTYDLKRITGAGVLEDGIITTLSDVVLRDFMPSGDLLYWVDGAAQITYVDKARTVRTTGVFLPAGVRPAQMFIAPPYLYYVAANNFVRIDTTHEGASAEALGAAPTLSSLFVHGTDVYFLRPASDGSRRSELVRFSNDHVATPDHIAWLPVTTSEIRALPEGVFVTAESMRTGASIPERRTAVWKLPPL